MKKADFDSKYFKNNEISISFFQSTSKSHDRAKSFMIRRIAEHISEINNKTSVAVLFSGLSVSLRPIFIFFSLGSVFQTVISSLQELETLRRIHFPAEFGVSPTKVKKRLIKQLLL